ncbi:MAG: hypothetical protein N2V75_07050 [Methanophagales archaeon]|nr:hypothetical protein [Methanophagales archaeon]
MAMLVEKGSIRGTARAMGVDKDTVTVYPYGSKERGNTAKKSRNVYFGI